MGDCKRSTRECTLESLPAELAAAIRKHIEQYHLSVFSPASMCIETTSDKIKKDLFSRASGSGIMGLIVSPGWLV